MGVWDWGWVMAGLVLSGGRVEGKLLVVTTTEDLAALARAVGGDAVETVSLAKGAQDPHFVEAKPSHLVKLRQADLFIQVGLELEIGWAPGLVANARNGKIQPGQEGFLEAWEGCQILERPEGRVDRSQGDVHPLGNPHYWTDPENGRMMARAIAARLERLAPGEAAGVKTRLATFERELTAAMGRWTKQMAPFRGSKIVTYHRSWTNFSNRFGLDVVDYIEPRPGIPPSAAHVKHLVDSLPRSGVRAIVIEPYFDRKLAERLQADTGIPLVVLPPSVGGTPEVKTYLDLFDLLLGRLAEAFRRTVKP